REALLAMTPSMTFRAGMDPDAWQEKLGDKLREILVLPDQRDSPLGAQVGPAVAQEFYTVQRVRYDSEPGVAVPGYLLKPRQGEGPCPVMICLQGHTKEGMKLSLSPDAPGGRAFALAAVRNGWAALAIEQRCFGERAGDCTRESLH